MKDQHQLTSAFIEFAESLKVFDREKQKLSTTPEAGEIREHLAKYDFEKPVPREELYSDVLNMLEEWTLHSTNPKYLGLYNPTTSDTAVVADAMVSFFNPQLAVWWHAPGAVEMELHILNHVASKIGYNPEKAFASFTTGGSESNMTALLMAIADSAPDYIRHGLRSMLSPPTVYVCETAHHSFIKVVKNIGIGIDHLRTVPVDKKTRQMDVVELQRMLEFDEEKGFIPTVIVATAGTTSMGIVDPIEEIHEIAKEFGMWLHVDAAFGGGALMSLEHAGTLKGIELADSVTIDAHKFFSVPFGAGMFFSKHGGALPEDVFGINADYVPKAKMYNNPTINFYTSTIQWTRRFLGLKLFMELSELGDEEFGKRTDAQFKMADYLREKLMENGWDIVNKTKLPVVCFTNDRFRSGELTTQSVLEKLYEQGDSWISDVDDKPAKVFRACITHYNTTKEDVDFIIDQLAEYLV